MMVEGLSVGAVDCTWGDHAPEGAALSKSQSEALHRDFSKRVEGRCRGRVQLRFKPEGSPRRNL
jgi:hypothetical protein